MDIGTIHSIWTLLVFIVFIGIVLWAWSGKRKPSFDKASMIPLEDDDSGLTENNSEEEAHG